MKFDNYTQYGIHEETERLVLTTYSATVFTSSLIGDVLILIGSLRYNAIKLHRLLVLIIQYIALADLLLTVFRTLPTAVSLAANRWMFGELFCRVGYFVYATVGGTLTLLITSLSFTKLLIVWYPLRAICFPNKIAHLATLFFFAYVFVLVALANVSCVDDIYFSYSIYDCEMDRSQSRDSGWTVKISFMMAGLTLTICIAVLAVSCVMLIVIAKRITDRGPDGLQWQGIITVVVTVAVFVVGILPMAVYFLVSTIVALPWEWEFYFWRVAYSMTGLIMLSNFYIYAFTISSFRQFLKSRIKLISAPFVRCCGTKGTEKGERQRLLNGQ